MTLLQIGVAVVLLLGNAVFVGAEFSAISVRRAMLEPMAETSAMARRVLHDLRHLSMLLAGAQLGITLCSLGLGAVAEPAVARLLEDLLGVAQVPAALLHPIAFAIALTLVVFLHMVLGEMVPKNLSLASPERLSLVLVPALAAFVRLTRPLILLLNGLANGGLRLLQVEPKNELESAHTPEELAEIIAESRSEGLLDPNKHDRLTGALALENLTARDIMIPVGRLITVPPSITADQLEDLVAETGYSRFPVSAERAEESAGSAGSAGSVGTAGTAGAPVRAAAAPRTSATATVRTPPARATAARARPRLIPARVLPVRGRPVSTSTADPADGAELLGFVHAKDVLGLSAAARRQPLPLQRLRTMPALAPAQPLSDVLTELQRLGSHLGQVRENNRTVGVIALEDVVEAFVGEVEDASHLDAEHDPSPGHEHAPSEPMEIRAADDTRPIGFSGDTTGGRRAGTGSSGAHAAEPIRHDADSAQEGDG